MTYLNDELRMHACTRALPWGCWHWTKSQDSNGYGHLRVGSRLEKAHRHAYTVWVGPIPDGLQVLHDCDNPRCCNPAHLHLGTLQQNMAERDQRGRGGARRGSAHWKYRVTPAIHAQLREGRTKGLKLRELAQAFRLSVGHISKLLQEAP